MALTHWACFIFYLKKTDDDMALRISLVFRRLVRLGSFPACLEAGQSYPNSERSTVLLLCCHYRPISITSVLSKVFECLVSVSSWMIYGTQWCASKHPVCLSERSRYLSSIFVACPIPCKVHWRVGRRLGSCRLISVQPLIVNHRRNLYRLLWVLEVLCCLY